MTDEEFYDAEIAPALADLAKKCQERGMSVLAMVTYDDVGSVGRTISLAKDAPLIMRTADTLARCWAAGGSVNFDSFMFAVMRDQRDKPHNSMVLAQLGCTPANPSP